MPNHFDLYLLLVMLTFGLSQVTPKSHQPNSKVHFPNAGSPTFPSAEERPITFPKSSNDLGRDVVGSSGKEAEDFLRWAQKNPKRKMVGSGGVLLKAAPPPSSSVDTDISDQCLTCGSHLTCKHGERRSNGKCVPTVSIP